MTGTAAGPRWWLGLWSPLKPVDICAHDDTCDPNVVLGGAEAAGPAATRMSPVDIRSELARTSSRGLFIVTSTVDLGRCRTAIGGPVRTHVCACVTDQHQRDGPVGAF